MKAEIIKRIQDNHPTLDKKNANQIFNLFTNFITLAVSQNYRIEFRGFGIFEKRHRKLNHSTNKSESEVGKNDKISYAYFKPSKRFSEIINSQEQ